MTILSNGKVAVNNSTVATNSQFEVNNDMNLTSSAQNHGYRINDVVLLQNPGVKNTFIGELAGYNNTGQSNFFAGRKAGEVNTSGSWNTYIGNEAGLVNTTGYQNTFVGEQSGFHNVSGLFNAFFGHQSGYENVGSDNTYIGAHAGVGSVSTAATGSRNTFVGSVAGGAIVGGEENAALGYFAGRYNTTGSRNVFVGSNTGYFNSTGSDNTFIGNQAGANTALNLHNASAIGSGATVLNDNKMILGNNDVNVGIGLSGLSGPHSKLEINTAVTGTSGLQFTQLTSTSGTQVLSVDNQGKVILVTDQTGGSVTAQNGLSITGSNTVELGANPLIRTTIIEMARHPLQLDLTTNTEGYVGIGTMTSIAKLNVAGSREIAANNSNTEVAASFEAVENDPSFNYGNKIVVSNAKEMDIGSDIYVTSGTGTINNAGVWCNLDGTSKNGSLNHGGYFNNSVYPDAGHKIDNRGVAGMASNGNNGDVGVYGEASNGETCIGVQGIAHDGGFSIGVYGKAFTGTGPTWAGYFDGDVYATGLYYFSDSLLKTNIRPVTNAGSLLSRVQVKSYVFDTTNFPSMNLPHGNQYGVIAEEIERVLPELVKTSASPNMINGGTPNGQSISLKAVNYAGLIPLLIANSQEQRSVIDSLQARLKQLEESFLALSQTVNSCCNATRPKTLPGNPSTIDLDLGASNSIILNQNDPNPFAEETKIGYNIPEDVQKAEIIFYDNKGRVLKTIVINERGTGTIRVFASNLSSGIYTYSLIADNKLIDTKKMVCSK